MAQGEYTHLVLLNDKAVEGDIPGRPKRNHQLADVTFDAASHQRMCSEVIDGGFDGIDRGLFDGLDGPR